MQKYQKPSITELGSFAELTLTQINKTAGSGDVIVIGGVSTPVPGGEVSSLS